MGFAPLQGVGHVHLGIVPDSHLAPGGKCLSHVSSATKDDPQKKTMTSRRRAATLSKANIWTRKSKLPRGWANDWLQPNRSVSRSLCAEWHGLLHNQPLPSCERAANGRPTWLHTTGTVGTFQDTGRLWGHSPLVPQTWLER